MNESVTFKEFGYSVPIHWGWIPAMLVIIGIILFRVYRLERGPSSTWVRNSLFFVRFSLCGIVLVAAMNWFVVEKRLRKSELIFAFDQSESLKLLDQLPDAGLLTTGENEAALPSRINVLKNKLAEAGDAFLSAVRKRFTLKGIAFGSELSGLKIETMDQLVDDLTADRSQTKLDYLFQQLLLRKGQAIPVGVVVFTDGLDSNDRSFQSLGELAKQKGIPFFPVGLGEKRPANDLRVTSIEANRRAFLSDLVEFRVGIAADGFANQKTRLQLIDETAEEIVAEREISIPVDQHRDLIRFRVRMNREGSRNFIARIYPSENEFDTQNNQKSARVLVDADQIRVLLASSYPSREFHFLKHFLGRDSVSDPAEEFATNRIQLDTFLQQADIDYTSVDRHAIKIFPVTRRQLFEYDVVIFCDLKPNWAGNRAGGISSNEINNLREFVEERGGGLVLVAGPRYTPEAYLRSPIADLLPFESKSLFRPDQNQDPRSVLNQAYKIRKTLQGERFLPLELGTEEEPKKLVEFPGAYWFASSTKLKPAATVLAEFFSGTKSYPALVIQKVGNGSVMYQAMPETYRWRYRTNDIYFGRYWSQIIQYLASAKLTRGKQSVFLETNRQLYHRAEAVTLYGERLGQSTLNNEKMIVRLQNRSGRERKIQLRKTEDNDRLYSATLPDLGAGIYEVSLVEDESVKTSFEIVETSRENQQEPINEVGLRQLAIDSGGEYLKIQDLDRLESLLPEADLVEVGSEPPRYYWNDWKFACLFGLIIVVLLTGEWVLRKKISML